MSDDSARPAKRARLDDSSAPALDTPNLTSAQAPQAPEAIATTTATTTATKPTVIDSELEREVRAGITEYVCPDNLGFTGTLKQRYTDFLVNEIGLDGEVLHLTSTEVEKKESVKQDEKVVEKKKAEVAVTEEKIELKEEKADEEMRDVQNGGDAAPATDVKVEGEAVEKDAAKQEEETKEEELPEEDLKTLHSIFGEESTSKIITLVRQVRKREHKKARDFKAVISPPITDKDVRTQAHQSLRRIFPNMLESSMEEDQSIRIKATPPAERKGKKKGRGERVNPDGARNRGQMGWEELGGEFLHFTLYKENKDTMEVVGFLGSKLNSGARAFGFAGTKDRRACTVQRVCIKRQTAERMHGFNKVLYNAAIGDYEYRQNDLKLGDLMGNEFTITLRDCSFQGEDGMDFEQRHQLANDVVRKAVDDFSEKGFINYYGLQRFGSFAASTDSVGLKMLQDDLKGAVDDLLAYSDVALAAALGTSTDPSVLVSQDDRNRAHALHLWKTEGKSSAALDMLPRKFTAERNIIQHLSSRNGRNGRRDRTTDWQGALMTIPRTLRLMYVHAYQSLVWNVVAGKRWATHGDKVVPGDLVLVAEHLDKDTAHPLNTEKDTADQDGEFVINPSGAEDANATTADFERARPLSAQEAASGQYTIWDVVLPQPGFDVEYPHNDIGAFYTHFMASDKGGGLDPLNMRRPWREVSLSGGYRKFLARPLRPVGVEVRTYGRADEQFVETDLQRVREGGGAGRKEGERGGEKDVDMQKEEGEEVEEQEKKIAVVVKLQLGSSQYATMALRELMKAGGVKAFKPEFMGGR
ncbi:tRNA pseudouridine synthase D [Dothidotthia symphoricarpi CBS 119687]|uniref:tRNA pseudouridine synthase D n=1 Tax=Dothidotthia symphoricarpi CBS 119687 TaxID=1392245 RepID=A0A6A6A1I8_9PLEO|nr:tRNA pseudouridine synthase D [Dothidotthia symphoricarpi CBS 119687]KAF2124817.1 tRNA pseudouridine synthase D [Dothidotthia symphoricarpi CBS 119687]